MKHFLCLLIVVLSLTSVMCDKNDSNSEELLYKAFNVFLKLNGPRYQGSFYTGYLPLVDYAFWIEDANHNFVKTLKITPSVVSVDSMHGSHTDHLPNWIEASGITYQDLEDETQDGVAPSFNALTSASFSFTQDTSAQTLSAVWDLTDKEGNMVRAGVFYCCAEASNIIKNQPDSYTVNAEHISIKVDLIEGTFEEAEPTEHLLEMTATFEKKDGEAISKKQSVVGP